MTNTTILIPDDILPAVQKYTSLKKEFNESIQAAQEMKKLAAQAPAESRYDPVTQLTADGAPPVELFAAQRELTQMLTTISEAQQAIELNEQEIEKIKSSAHMYTIAIIIGTILIALVVIMILVNG